MTAFARRSLLLGNLLLAGMPLSALPACAAPPSQTTLTTAASGASMAIDLGSSSRVPRTRLVMALAAHDANRKLAPPATSDIQPVADSGDVAATGKVNAVDPAQHKINLSHNPIPAIGWPAMTMDFPVAPGVDLSRIKPGAQVNVSMKKSKNGMYEVQSVQPAGPAK